ncbi:MAG: CRTAC1 family protein [bacterium]
MKAIILFAALFSTNSFAQSSLDAVLNNISQLESSKEPKCYATASRLEDFMFGTPLSPEARSQKNLLLRDFASSLWGTASGIARSQNHPKVTSEDIIQAINTFLKYEQKPSGEWKVSIASKRHYTIKENDYRQYSSIAYSLRAILAAQQNALFDTSKQNLTLSEPATQALKQALDLLSLAFLYELDRQSRLSNQFIIEKPALEQTWADWLSLSKTTQVSAATNAQQSTAPYSDKLLRALIDQKIKSYAKYNKVNTQLFVRNLQVYFSRASWPNDPENAKIFRQNFTELLISFSISLYEGAQGIAIKLKHPTIQENDVYQFARRFIPHHTNQYEDATFFPQLDKNQQVFIESYDMDAFRDSGLHWRYLQLALDDQKINFRLPADPFSAELLVENIAQFGVLVLRVAGNISKEHGRDRLLPEDLQQATKRIQQRIDESNSLPSTQPTKAQIVSSSSTTPLNDVLFNDVTSQLTLNYQHRSSDWLNRLLRSYLPKNKEVGIITIPPAFGGSGLAAEDIDNDGWVDLLFLGGLGNKLYINNKGKGFIDYTVDAGLDWKREDGTYPESRQALIADLDNDGQQDIVITYVDDTHRVYKNLGKRQFKDMTSTAKLGGKNTVAGPAILFDYDQDGLIDLYIGYFGDYLHAVLPTLKRRNTNGLANQLFKNTGDFHFVNVTEHSGLDNTGWTQALTHTDLNGDGWQDVIVGNDFGVNSYYINQKNGRFIDQASKLNVDKPSYTMGIGSTDLNNDKRPDIYISNIVTMNKDERYVMPDANTRMKFDPEKMANMRVVEANDLFISTTGGSYQQFNTLMGRGLSSTGWSWDADFFDADNDGDDDIYILNGMNEFNLYSSKNPYYTDPNDQSISNIIMPVDTYEKNVFLLNENKRFENRSSQSGLDFYGNSRSAVYFDFDHDGDLDIATNDYHGKAHIFENKLDPGSSSDNSNWLKIKLTASQHSNRDAIGSTITVKLGNGHKVWRQIQSTTGYLSVHPKVQHFGLGSDHSANTSIRWPNGATETLNLKANQFWCVQQNSKGPSSLKTCIAK